MPGAGSGQQRLYGEGQFACDRQPQTGELGRAIRYQSDNDARLELFRR